MFTTSPLDHSRSTTKFLAVLALITVTIFPCALTAQDQGTVKGDIYLVTGSGEIRPGAANEVFLISREQDLASQWAEFCARQSADFEARQEESERLQQSLDERIEAARGREQANLRREKLALLQSQIDQVIQNSREQLAERQAWLRGLAVASDRTGREANFEISASPGDYYLYALQPLGDQDNQWLVPITINGGQELQMDLDNSNLKDPQAFGCRDLFD
jgi:hypothetical protein